MYLDNTINVEFSKKTDDLHQFIYHTKIIQVISKENVKTLISMASEWSIQSAKYFRLTHKFLLFLFYRRTKKMELINVNKT